MSEIAITTPFGVSGEALRTAEFLEKPEVILDHGAVLKVLAVSTDTIETGQKVAMGFVATKSGRAVILGEFSGKPTGECMPCNAVKGFVGEEVIYDKNVPTDMPLSGLRTAIAQRRAARAVKSRLKG